MIHIEDNNGRADGGQHSEYPEYDDETEVLPLDLTGTSQRQELDIKESDNNISTSESSACTLSAEPRKPMQISDKQKEYAQLHYNTSASPIIISPEHSRSPTEFTQVISLPINQETASNSEVKLTNVTAQNTQNHTDQRRYSAPVSKRAALPQLNMAALKGPSPFIHSEVNATETNNLDGNSSNDRLVLGPFQLLQPSSMVPLTQACSTAQMWSTEPKTVQPMNVSTSNSSQPSLIRTSQSAPLQMVQNTQNMQSIQVPFALENCANQPSYTVVNQQRESQASNSNLPNSQVTTHLDASSPVFTGGPLQLVPVLRHYSHGSMVGTSNQKPVSVPQNPVVFPEEVLVQNQFRYNKGQHTYSSMTSVPTLAQSGITQLYKTNREQTKPPSLIHYTMGNTSAQSPTKSLSKLSDNGHDQSGKLKKTRKETSSIQSKEGKKIIVSSRSPTILSQQESNIIEVNNEVGMKEDNENYKHKVSRTNAFDTDYSYSIIKRHEESMIEERRINRLITIQSSNKPYRCNLCKKGLSTAQRIKQHIVRHLGARPYKCNKCYRRYNQHEALKRHIKSCTNVPKVPTKERDQSTADVVNETQQSPFYCAICTTQFAKYSQFEEHMKEHQDMQSYALQNSSKDHLPNMIGYSCTLCNKEFPSKKLQEEHFSWHKMQERYWECKDCHLRFHGDVNLFIKHMKDKHNQKVAIQIPKNIDTAESNTKVEQKADADTAANEANEEAAAVKFTLQKIQMTSTVTKQKERRKYYKCQLCPSVFYREDEFGKHMKEHEEGAIFTCESCGMKFETNSELTKHYSTHEGVRPYKCSVCHNAFIQSSHLKFHMRRHTGEKPFSCHVCNKKFPRRAHLQEHMYLHSSEKLHACHICDKRFTQPSGLRSHMKRTHPDQVKKTYKCPFCPVSFSKKNVRAAHISAVHSDKDTSVCLQDTSEEKEEDRNYENNSITNDVNPEPIIDDNNTTEQTDRVNQIIALPVKMTDDKIVVFYEDKLVMEWAYDNNCI